jgi:hypothetical protein
LGLIEKEQLIKQLAQLDNELVTQLVTEFISMEKRFIQRDWEPTELDGGQFCEILARIIYHVDSGHLNRTKGVDDCIGYIENDKSSHAVEPRHNAIHLGRVIRTAYKFRSQRGAVHISPTYNANHLDSKFLIECVRWLMNEFLRIFWQGDRELVAKAIRELLQFDVPCIGTFEGALLVQRTDLSPEEEVLLLLHHAGENGFTRMELGKHAKCPSQRISDAVKNLTRPGVREVILLSKGNYALTDLGHKRIRERLSARLLLQ